MRKSLRNIPIKTIVFAIILLLPITIFAMDLNVDYPDFGYGTLDFSERASHEIIPAYIFYIFNFILGISGLIIMFSLMVGGFQFLTSVGDPNKRNEGKKRIFSSLIGVGLILGSWMIINTINPQLLNLSISDIETEEGDILSGVYIFSEEKEVLLSPGINNLDNSKMEDWENIVSINAGGKINEESGNWDYVTNVNYWAIILHSEKNGQGKCTVSDNRLLLPDGAIVFKKDQVPFEVKSITVINQEPILTKINNPKFDNLYTVWKDFIEHSGLSSPRVVWISEIDQSAYQVELWDEIGFSGNRTIIGKSRREAFQTPIRYNGTRPFFELPSNIKNKIWSIRLPHRTAVLLVEGGGSVHNKCQLITRDLEDMSYQPINKCDPQPLKDNELYWLYGSCATHYHVFPLKD